MVGWELIPHSIQKLFGLLIIAEIDEWDIDFILIVFKRDMDFWKLKNKNDEWYIDLPTGEVPITYAYLMVWLFGMLIKYSMVGV